MPEFDSGRLKKILIDQRGPIQNCSDELTVVPSTDRQHAVVFSHGWEMTMMNWSYFFTLLDKDLCVVEKFDQMRSSETSCSWSGDSSMFAVSGSAWQGLLIWNLHRRTYAIVRISSRQFVFRFQHTSDLLIQFNPDQLRAMNSNAVFGGGKAECPVKRFKAPADSIVPGRDLRWHKGDKLSDLEKIAKESSMIDMNATADGFYPFTGKFPATTTDVFNGRNLEVFQLEIFAEYGDKQAQEWLREVKKRVPTDSSHWARARWTPVSKHLGFQARKIPIT
jgi:hypothetical protein